MRNYKEELEKRVAFIRDFVINDSINNAITTISNKLIQILFFRFGYKKINLPAFDTH